MYVRTLCISSKKLLLEICTHTVAHLHFSIQHGVTALHKASGAGQTTFVTLLLDHGADVQSVDKWVSDSSTALGLFQHRCRKGIRIGRAQF